MEYLLEKSENAYLLINFRDHQEELCCPFSVGSKGNFLYAAGYQNEQRVEFVIPIQIECYFEIREDMPQLEK